MEITIEDKAILAHVVIDPDAWVEHALATIGEKAVTAKIERYRAEYLAKKDLPDYMNRAERDAFELTEIEANKPIPTYADLRRAEHLPIPEQLDMMYWDGINGTTVWQDYITDIKVRIPKA